MTLLNKFIENEKDLYQREFLAPVFNRSKINLLMNGVKVSFRVIPYDYSGFGVFKPISAKYAEFVRKCSLLERRRYLELFPRAVFIICEQENSKGILLVDNGRFKISGLVPIHLCENIGMFDSIDVRFDGNLMWYDRHNRHNPLICKYLRDSFQEDVKPNELSFTGLTKPHISAYTLAFQSKLDELKRIQAEEEAVRLATVQGRISSSIERGGGVLNRYTDRGNSYSIEFTVDGKSHRSVVTKDTLRVQSSGICLSNRDADFDLQSLCGVFRENDR